MNLEEKDYTRYTGPQELQKATNILKGILSGISCDQQINEDEINELVHWCQLHAFLDRKAPFSEILPIIDDICNSKKINKECLDDILWLCSNFSEGKQFYDTTTSTIQILGGMLHGIMADGVLTDDEVLALREWLNEHEFLAGTYPFDEITSLITSTLEDRKIDEDERNILMAYFSNVIEMKNSFNLQESELASLRKEYSVEGVCAWCPNIKFNGNTFVFTGTFNRGTRNELIETTTNLGGRVTNTISSVTSYLVVGNSGNRCWAYACHGRKIEAAITFRKQGAKVIIVNETDFWDAVEKESCKKNNIDDKKHENNLNENNMVYNLEDIIPEDDQDGSKGFNCCSRYRDCSDSGKCIITHLDYSADCQYRTTLEKGNIFYGKSANNFSREEYEKFLQKIENLSPKAKEIFDHIIINTFEYNRGSSFCIIRADSTEELSAIPLFDVSVMAENFLNYCSYPQIKKHIKKNEKLLERYLAVKYPDNKIPNKISFYMSQEKFIKTIQLHDPEFFNLLASPYRLLCLNTDYIKCGEEYYKDYIFDEYDSHIYSLSPLAEDDLLVPMRKEEEITRLNQRNSIKNSSKKMASKKQA